MNYAHIVNPIAAASNEAQPLPSTKPELPVLSELELLLCGGGQDTPCW